MKTGTTTARKIQTVTPRTVVLTAAFGVRRNDAAGVVNGYTAGVSIARLATKFGFGTDAVRNLLVANNVAIRPRGRYKATAVANN